MSNQRRRVDRLERYAAVRQSGGWCGMPPVIEIRPGDDRAAMAAAALADLDNLALADLDTRLGFHLIEIDLTAKV